jgi:hypothetical protein
MYIKIQGTAGYIFIMINDVLIENSGVFIEIFRF